MHDWPTLFFAIHTDDACGHPHHSSEFTPKRNHVYTVNDSDNTIFIPKKGSSAWEIQGPPSPSVKATKQKNTKSKTSPKGGMCHATSHIAN